MSAPGPRGYSGSRMGRMRRFFIENPGEYLTAEDVAQKFGVTKRMAQKYMADLAAEGLTTSATIYYLNPERPR